MRKYINIVNNMLAESVRVVQDTDTKGKVKRVVAYLDGQHSAKFTRLAKNLLAIEQKEQELKQLRDAVKEDDRVQLASLFAAEDCVHTRIVHTINFVFEMSKDPKPASTVQYAKVVKELVEHLTPDLLEVLNNLVETHTTVQAPKPPKLSVKSNEPVETLPDPVYHVDDEDNNQLSENDQGQDQFKGLLTAMNRWAAVYDRALDHLQQMV
jgi:hypothetical protein